MEGAGSRQGLMDALVPEVDLERNPQLNPNSSLNPETQLAIKVALQTQC